jgi:hypothetical protein
VFTIEFTVREAGKVETVTGAEYRTKKAAEKALAGYVAWGKKAGKPPTVKVVPVVH